MNGLMVVHQVVRVIIPINGNTNIYAYDAGCDIIYGMINKGGGENEKIRNQNS